ncbi:MAG: hypothetical protein EAY75_03275 [Bacteroidetes bacterium]|nr:MAG: hypothetical protein EAY75_03275 [Bacteroidota bacterium]
MMRALDNWASLIPADFSGNSRVWIYQASRRFGLAEALEIEALLEDFLARWNSHGTPVKGYANLLFGQFLVLMADETATGVSGCSTDSSVRLVKDFEQRYAVDFFNRLSLAFVVKDQIEILPLSQLGYAFEHGFVAGDTLYFNNLVATKQDLLNKWLVPVKDSWLASRLKLLPA